jgi:hypothetical protein
MKVVFAMLAAMATGCGSTHVEAAPSDHPPSIEVKPIDKANLCVTKGNVTDFAVSDPTVRGYAIGAGGDAAQLTFTYRGESENTRELASGDARHQIGLKLRAQDSCNVVYVMWRLDPVPKIDVSVKFNPGMRLHQECGANGYTKVKPYRKPFVTGFEYGKTHSLRAEIVGDELFAWIDGKLLWQGRLPESARTIKGPVGIRSDNVKFDIVELSVPAPQREGAAAACKREPGSD